MTTMKHIPDSDQPLPWAVCEKPPNDHWYQGSTIYSVEANTRVADVCVQTQNFKANAAFIVRACNCHDELVAALSNALQYMIVAHRDGVEHGLRQETLDIAKRDFENAQAILAKATKGE